MDWSNGTQYSGGNPDILPSERQSILSKLTAFLAEFLGAGVDAHARATEMAYKFEDHVYKSTKTKDEYIQTIQARMRLIHSKKSQPAPISEPPPPPSIPEQISQLNQSEQYIFIAKMEQFKNLLPKMEKLIEMHGRLGTNPEMIRKYAGFKNVIQRQIDLLPSNTFVMPTNVLNGIFEQASKMTVYLATKAKELLASQPNGGSIQAPSIPASDLGDRSKKASRRASITDISAHFQQLPAKEAFKIEPDLKLLQWEVEELSKEFDETTVMLSPREDGVFVIVQLIDGSEVIFKVPPNYPSIQTFQCQVTGRLNDFEHIPFGTSTLTSTIRRLLHSG